LSLTFNIILEEKNHLKHQMYQIFERNNLS